MLRARPLVIMALSLLAGILAARSLGAHSTFLTLLAVSAVLAALLISVRLVKKSRKITVLFLHRRKRGRQMKWKFALVACAFFLLGFVRCQILLEHQLRIMQSLTEGQEIIIRGRVYALEPRKRGVRILLGQAQIQTRERGREWELGKIYVDDWIGSIGQGGIRPELGDRVCVSGSYSPGPTATNEGGFDGRSCEYGRGIYGHLRKAVNFVRLTEGSCHPYWYLRQMLERLRSGLERVFDRNLPAEEAGLLSAMALGIKSSLDTEARDLFVRSGLSHILAISGLHVFLLGSLLLRLLRHLRLTLPLASFLSGIGIIAYGMMTGNAVSTQRAVWMYLILLLGKCLGETYDSMSALAMAALVILIPNPMALGDLSFQFSFTAILGMQLVARPMQKRYRSACAKRFEKRQHQLLRMRQWQLPWNRGRDRMPHRYQASLTEHILGQMILALGIQMASLPLLAFYYSEIPLYVFFLNLLLLPLLGLLLGSGLLGGVLGLAAAGAVFLKPLMSLCLGFCHCLIYFFEWSSDLSLRLPWARVITGKPPIWLIFLYYGGLFYFLYERGILYERGRKRSVSPWRKVFQGHACSHRVRRTISAGIALALFLAPSMLWSVSLPHLAKAEFTMLDIGQGDGLYFCDGRGGHYMIDGGSTSLDQVGKQRILPFLKARGIRRIHYWFVSHTDLDHISGLEEALMERYPIQNLVFSANMPHADKGRNPAYERLAALARRNGCRILLWDQGDQLVAGTDSKGDGQLLVRCLGPDRDSSARGANENSLILSIVMPGLSVFSAGDIGREQEEILLRRGIPLGERKKGDLSLYKASHHGSNGANSREILQKLKPDLIWISAGIRNRYGHPGKEALERMRKMGCHIDRTMHQGQMTLQREGRAWKYRVRFP